MRVSSLFEDYVRFHRIQMANRDVDPVYPVLREIGDSCDWNQEMRVISVFLHVAYYDLGSTLAAVERFRAHSWQYPNRTAKLTCGTERRRHRMGDNLAVHLAHLDRIAGDHNGLRWWVERELGNDPVANWRRVTENLMGVHGNGRWAAFKTCEMLSAVCGLPLEAPDMGHANSSGPRQGLGLLYPEAGKLVGNRAEVISQLDEMSGELVRDLRARGEQASAATAETTLCDFHSMVEGRYYPGLDIDVMQEQIERAPLSPHMRARALDARRAVLPEAYLGEIGGRVGGDRARKRVYRLTGEIVERG